MERNPKKEPDVIGDVHRPPIERSDPTDLDFYGPKGGSASAFAAHDPKPEE